MQARPFTDPLPSLIAHLRARLNLTGGAIADTTPSDLHERDLFVRVTDGGVGGDDTITDWWRFDVDVFATDATRARQAGEDIRAIVLALPSVGAAGFKVDTARTITRPRALSWPTPGVYRVGVTFDLTMRRQLTH